MADGKLRERLDRLESSLLTLTKQLDSLVEKYNAAPTPLGKEAIDTIAARLDLVQSEIAKLQPKTESEKTEAEDSALYDYYFGRDTGSPSGRES